jgi:hypothetical protein
MGDYTTLLNRELKNIVPGASKCLAPICLMFTAFIQLAFTPIANAAATFTPLGVFNGTRSVGFDVSADGSVVVGMTIDPAVDRLRVFRWTEAGTTFGPVSSDSVAVSANGLVLGF